LLGLSVGYVQHGMSAAQRRQAYAADVTYVTAKDAGSVQALLQHADVDIPDAHIYGECTDKVAALDIISEYFRVPRHDISFFDDNVLHAREAHLAGFRAHWATWGYHATEHFGIAAAAGLPAVKLEDLVGLDAQAAA